MLYDFIQESFKFEKSEQIVVKCDEIKFDSFGFEEDLYEIVQKVKATSTEKDKLKDGATLTCIIENKDDVKVSLGSSTLNQLVMNQRALGFWSIDKLDFLLNAMAIEKDDFKNLVIKCQDTSYVKMKELKGADKLGPKPSLTDEEVLTLLVLASLRKNFVKEIGKWKLIEKKALKWLTEKKITYADDMIKSFVLVVC